MKKAEIIKVGKTQISFIEVEHLNLGKVISISCKKEDYETLKLAGVKIKCCSQDFYIVEESSKEQITDILLGIIN